MRRKRISNAGRLRQSIARNTRHHEADRRYQDLERENQRLIAEIEALRRQSLDASQTRANELLLETLLAAEVGAPSSEPSYRWSATRRFRKRTDAA